MRSIEIVVKGANFPPLSISRLDVDLTAEQLLEAVRAVTKAADNVKQAFAGLVSLVAKMPGGSAVPEVSAEPLIGADTLLVADCNDYVEGVRYWEYTLHNH